MLQTVVARTAINGWDFVQPALSAALVEEFRIQNEYVLFTIAGPCGLTSIYTFIGMEHQLSPPQPTQAPTYRH